MKNLSKIIGILLCISMLLLGLCSCGADYTDEEILKTCEKLVEKSLAINEIYFGKGLPVSAEDSEEAKKFAEENGFLLENIQFLPVTADSPYKSVDKIKAATAKVYSESYCEYLYDMAFEGYSSEDGTAAVFAKYMEDESGVLCARIDLVENAFSVREYDYSTMKVISKKSDEAVIEATSYLEGEKEDAPVRFTLVKEADGWRLDSPTY